MAKLGEQSYEHLAALLRGAYFTLLGHNEVRGVR
jgi:hypothetical protein